MHYYKFNVAGWAKDTSHLSLKEEAIYLRLINFYYDHEKPIPLKTHLVLRKLRMADESETVDIILEEFFTKTKDGWIQNHCEKLIGEYQKMAERNKKNAKLGGRPKINNLEKPSGNQDGNQEETESNPKGIPNYKLETNNQELETNNEKPDTKKQIDFAPLAFNSEEIKEFKEIRARKKGAVTQRVVNEHGKQFELSRKRGYSNDDILNEWSNRGWTAYKDEWMRVPVKKAPPQQQQYDHEAARQREIEEIRKGLM